MRRDQAAMHDVSPLLLPGDDARQADLIQRYPQALVMAELLSGLLLVFGGAGLGLLFWGLYGALLGSLFGAAALVLTAAVLGLFGLISGLLHGLMILVRRVRLAAALVRQQRWASVGESPAAR